MNVEQFKKYLNPENRPKQAVQELNTWDECCAELKMVLGKNRISKIQTIIALAQMDYPFQRALTIHSAFAQLPSLLEVKEHESQ